MGLGNLDMAGNKFCKKAWDAEDLAEERKGGPSAAM